MGVESHWTTRTNNLASMSRHSTQNSDQFKIVCEILPGLQHDDTDIYWSATGHFDSCHLHSDLGEVAEVMDRISALSYDFDEKYAVFVGKSKRRTAGEKCTSSHLTRAKLIKTTAGSSLLSSWRRLPKLASSRKKQSRVPDPSSSSGVQHLLPPTDRQPGGPYSGSPSSYQRSGSFTGPSIAPRLSTLSPSTWFKGAPSSNKKPERS